VADSSRAKDLGPKAWLYAAAGIPEYWLVDLVNDVVLVHLHAEGIRGWGRLEFRLTHHPRGRTSPQVGS